MRDSRDLGRAARVTAGLPLSPAERVVTTLRVPADLRAIARRYDVGMFAVTRRALRLRRRGFTLQEADSRALLDPAVGEERLSRATSRAAAYALLDRLNPAPYRVLAKDKVIFARWCAGHGLPTPRTLAVFHRGADGWTPGGRAPRGRDEWIALIHELPDEFVVKPSRGRLGLGVRVLRRDGAALVDQDGIRRSAGELHDTMRDDRDWDAFLLQERIRPHPDIVRLTGADAVQSVRALTLVDRGGGVRLVQADLRVVLGDLAIDNWVTGTSGNGRCAVDLATGRLGPATTPRRGPHGLVSLAAHPRTGAAFADVVVPHWAESRDLLERAARAFAPLRAMGWDLVPAPGGPLLQEAGNRLAPFADGADESVAIAAWREALAGG